MFRALANRGFRLFFIGQSISLTGTWMQQAALGWLVYRLTHSAWWLGFVAFASQAPMLFLAPFAGVFADRTDRRKILLLTQSLACVQALLIAALAATGTIKPTHLLVLGFLLGCVLAVDFPTRQAFLGDLLEQKEDLGNAIALNAFMVHAARMTGPALAGALIFATSESVCFLFNAISYVAILFALSVLRPARPAPGRRTVRFTEHFKEGLSYALEDRRIRPVLVLVASISLFGLPYVALLPLIAGQVFGGDARTLGSFMAAAGAGALAAAAHLAARKSSATLERMLAPAAGLFGASLAAFAIAANFWLGAVLLLAGGYGATICVTASNAILQNTAEAKMRGRVISLHQVAFLGVVPIGSLAAGRLASQFGTPRTLLLGSAGCGVAALWFHLQTLRLRRESELLPS